MSELQVDPGLQAGLYRELSLLSGRDRTLNLEEVVLAEDAIEQLPRLIGSVQEGRRVTIVQDSTDIRRAGASLKPAVRDRLAALGYEVNVVELPREELHTTPDDIAIVQRGLGPQDAVIALGSGTITDITKHAVHEYEQANPGSSLRLVAVQTANSVVAYTSNQAVLTMGRVKRTVPSRLPDALVLDTRVLADCPAEYTVGGIGDTFVVAGSFADYRLANLLGFGKWEPLSWPLMRRVLAQFLDRDPILADRSPDGMGVLALDLAACGLSLSLAGESAPVSGLEHVTSHTLDMAADYYGRGVGNHGSQCGLATIFTLIAFKRLLSLESLEGLDPAQIDTDAERAKVQAAFGHLDETGQAWQECWSDYSAKIEAWRTHRDQVLAFVADWPTHRLEVSRYTTEPEDYMRSLAATGHPLRFEEIPAGLDEAQARWAFTNARLMRKRTSVADLLGFAGLWTEDFIDDVFATYHRLLARINE